MQDEGVVKRVVTDRGFGFVSMAGGPDVFFHVKDCDPSLPFDDKFVGRRVVFVVEQSPKGPRAAGVRAA